MAIYIISDEEDPANAFDDLMTQDREAREAADSTVGADQMLQAGDFCMSRSEGIAIYSEILDAAAHLLGSRKLEELDDEERAEVEDTRETYAAEHMKFFRFTRSYSVVCPRGELGDLHLSLVSRKLTKDEFETARKLGWK